MSFIYVETKPLNVWSKFTNLPTYLPAQHSAIDIPFKNGLFYQRFMNEISILFGLCEFRPNQGTLLGRYPGIRYSYNDAVK